ncbi:glycosyltransferase [Parabacteroides sp. Marseille-P3160]|uniref:glycosyltransferase n=1 Tax=Parabacteroides sp. Marseille-P3160 TaxID=1917887 RepID=UPI0009BA2206|nr:glycosyltransferase [Parabacteroides sp. Marseille-P3160]
MIETLLSFQLAEQILMGAAAALFLIQLYYYRVPYARPFRRLRREGEDAASVGKERVLPPVSVIVYAKNESENLKRFLPLLLKQDHPEYEVIVINDGSTDESDEVLKELETVHKNLYHTYIPMDAKYMSRKKLALTIGVKAAKHELLLFTEANCAPLSDHWVSSMAARYDAETEIVLGFCALESRKGFFSKLAIYDNLLVGLQYLSSALKSRPYMGEGGNLSYRKELFFKKKGFSKTLGLQSGEDDLFVNESGNRKNTKTIYTPESIIQRAPYERYRVWKERKVSRAATRKYYRGFSLFFYRLEVWTRLLFYISVVLSIVAGCFLNWLTAVVAGVLFALRLVFVLYTFHQSSRMLCQKPVTGWIPFLEIILPLYNGYISIYRLFWGKNDYTFYLER